MLKRFFLYISQNGFFPAIHYSVLAILDITNRGLKNRSSRMQHFDDSMQDDDSRVAFVKAMNEVSKRIGMKDSVFVRPAGDSDQNRSTARDLIQLAIAASRYPEISIVWGKRFKRIHALGSQRRYVFLLSTFLCKKLHKNCSVVGGKTGQWGSSRTLLCVCKADGGEFIAGVIAGAESDQKRFVAMKQLMQVSIDALRGEKTTDTVNEATIAISAKFQLNDNYNGSGSADLYLYEKEPDECFVPASLTKILTAITVLECVDDLDETFVFVSNDCIGGSGASFLPGDEITYRDALFALLLPSSNMTAHALARVVGQKILKKQDNTASTE